MNQPERAIACHPRSITSAVLAASLFTAVVAPRPARAAEPGDLDLDGDQDVDLVLTSRKGLILLLDAAGAGPLRRAIVLRDLDGDARIDAATADYASRALSVLRNAGGASAPHFRRGDADLDVGASITDAVVVLTRLFLGGAELPCEDKTRSTREAIARELELSGVKSLFQ